MPTFEDLLAPPRKACLVCDFIESLEPDTDMIRQVDAAMAKAKYSEAALERGLKAVAQDGSPRTPSDSTIRKHREEKHRQ